MALKRLANVPPNTAFQPKRAISCFLLGAIPPMPPINIAIDEILANPHKENVTIAIVFGDNVDIISERLVNATNSFNIIFCPINDPAITDSFIGTPIIVAIGAKIYPKIDCKLKLSIPNNPPINPIIPFISAINATNANNIAAILRTNPKPSIAPLEAASTILDESSFTISISSLTFASLISGIIILEIISPAGADIKLADTKYSIGIPNNEYPTNIDPETEASPNHNCK